MLRTSQLTAKIAELEQAIDVAEDDKHYIEVQLDEMYDQLDEAKSELQELLDAE